VGLLPSVKAITASYKRQHINIYLAVFRSSRGGYADQSCSKSYHPLSQALKRGAWPYDVGDDPSFFSKVQNRSNLTWGVCRPQVRNRIQPGDIVVYFSVRQKEKEHPFEYQLCAVVTVEKKVRQTDVWLVPRFRKCFASYLNLVLRPNGRHRWRHSERGSEKPHKDWIWRIADHDGLKKSQFRPLEAKDTFDQHSRVGGRPVSIAANYVIFSDDKKLSRVLRHPPLTAVSQRNGQPETWQDDPFSKSVRAHLFGSTGKAGPRRKSLRSVHPQHSHPVIRWTLSVEEAIKWRKKLFGILDGSGR
jgi:hypothetical protein